MKISLWLCTLAIEAALAATNTLLAQSPGSFFPRAVGDVWQYGPPPTQLRTLTRDSLGNGSHFLFYDGEQLPSYIVDTLDRVFYVDPYSRKVTSMLYDLRAGQGETWVSQDTISPTTRIVARVDTILLDYIFGATTQVKYIGYYYQPVDSPTYWSSLRDTRALAAGFGYYSWIADPPAGYIEILYGCIIDGSRYGTLSSIAKETMLPDKSQLLPVYPNPFNSTAVVTYYISEMARVRITVIDILGEEVETLVDATQPAGRHSVRLEATSFSSAPYFVRMNVGMNQIVRKIILLR